jgi:hypothetical protein
MNVRKNVNVSEHPLCDQPHDYRQHRDVLVLRAIVYESDEGTLDQSGGVWAIVNHESVLR